LVGSLDGTLLRHGELREEPIVEHRPKLSCQNNLDKDNQRRDEKDALGRWVEARTKSGKIKGIWSIE